MDLLSALETFSKETGIPMPAEEEEPHPRTPVSRTPSHSELSEVKRPPLLRRKKKQACSAERGRSPAHVVRFDLMRELKQFRSSSKKAMSQRPRTRNPVTHRQATEVMTFVRSPDDSSEPRPFPSSVVK